MSLLQGGERAFASEQSDPGSGCCASDEPPVLRVGMPLRDHILKEAGVGGLSAKIPSFPENLGKGDREKQGIP